MVVARLAILLNMDPFIEHNTLDSDADIARSFEVDINGSVMTVQSVPSVVVVGDVTELHCENSTTIRGDVDTCTAGGDVQVDNAVETATSVRGFIIANKVFDPNALLISVSYGSPCAVTSYLGKYRCGNTPEISLTSPGCTVTFDNHNFVNVTKFEVRPLGRRVFWKDATACRVVGNVGRVFGGYYTCISGNCRVATSQTGDVLANEVTCCASRICR